MYEYLSLLRLGSIPEAARSIEAWVCGRSLAGIVVRILPQARIFVSCECCVVRWRSVRRADHSSRGVLSTVLRRYTWSRDLKKEEVMVRVGPQRHKKCSVESSAFRKSRLRQWTWNNGAVAKHGTTVGTGWGRDLHSFLSKITYTKQLNNFYSLETLVANETNSFLSILKPLQNSLEQYFPNGFARGPISDSKNNQGSSQSCSRKYSVFGW